MKWLLANWEALVLALGILAGGFKMEDQGLAKNKDESD